MSIIDVVLLVHENVQGPGGAKSEDQVPNLPIASESAIHAELEKLLATGDPSDPVELWLEAGRLDIQPHGAKQVIAYVRGAVAAAFQGGDVSGALLADAIATLAEEPLSMPLYLDLHRQYISMWAIQDLGQQKRPIEDVLKEGNHLSERAIGEWISEQRAHREIVVRFERPPFGAFLLSMSSTYMLTGAQIEMGRGRGDHALRAEGLAFIYQRLATELRDGNTALQMRDSYDARPNLRRIAIRGEGHRSSMQIALTAVGLEPRFHRIDRAEDALIEWYLNASVRNVPLDEQDRDVLRRHLLLADLIAAGAPVDAMRTVPTLPAERVNDWFERVGLSGGDEKARFEASATWVAEVA